MSALKLCSLGLVVALALGCDSNPQSDTPTTPTPTAIAEPAFTGTVTPNGAAVTNFVTTNAGIVTVTLSSLDPNPDLTVYVGMVLGLWNGTQCQAVTAVSNEKVGPGGGLVGQAVGGASLCVRVYDNGTLTTPVTFSIAIAHF
jgi:hypothetical protein